MGVDRECDGRRPISVLIALFLVNSDNVTPFMDAHILE